MAAGAGSWSHFPHEADIGIAASGPTPEAVFEQMALAMTGAITDPELVRPLKRFTVHCQAPDLELLLAEWLNALIFEMATREMLFRRFKVHIGNNRLAGAVWGEPVSRERHQPAVEIKGATYTDLAVRRREDGDWTARCVIDV
jgi:tRNA nucleotidyltransferase (CCA-adding enzyme)